MNKLLVSVCATLFAFVFTMGPVAAQGTSMSDTATAVETQKPADEKAGEVKAEAAKTDAVKTDVSKDEAKDVHQPVTVGDATTVVPSDEATTEVTAPSKEESKAAVVAPSGTEVKKGDEVKSACPAKPSGLGETK